MRDRAARRPSPLVAGGAPFFAAYARPLASKGEGGQAVTRCLEGPLETFEYEGNEYDSLSAVANAITGSHCNGFRFFKLEAK